MAERELSEISRAPIERHPGVVADEAAQGALFEAPYDDSAESDNFTYHQLVGHNRTNGSWKSTEQLHSEYIQLTDELVRQMTEGVRATDPKTGEVVTRVPDVVVWLDKSARPVSWLTSELWSLLAREKDGSVPTQPHNSFVNIDREQWVNAVDPLGVGDVDIERIDQSVIRSLRSIFMEPKQKQNGLNSDLDAEQTSLDGKTVLIVDELRSSGKTLDIAAKFFQRAFPEAAIATTHWMKSTVSLGSRREGVATGNADLPTWYREDSILGRQVGNRDQRISSKSHSLTQRLGAWFLSGSGVKVSVPDIPAVIERYKKEATTLDNLRRIESDVTKDGLKEVGAVEIPDPVSKRLRLEIKQLAKDANDGKVLIMPSEQREAEDAIRRATELNGFVSLNEYTKAKKSLLELT